MMEEIALFNKILTEEFGKVTPANDNSSGMLALFVTVN